MKRKFLSFVMFLAATLGLWAQAPAENVYALYSVADGAYVTRNGSWGSKAVMDQRPLALAVVSDAAAAGYFNLISADAQQKLFADGDGSGCFTDYNGQGEDRTRWAFEAAADGNFYIKNKQTGLYMGTTTSSILSLCANKAPADKMAWKLVKVADMEADNATERIAYLNAGLAANSMAAVASEADFAAKYKLLDVTSTVSIPGRGEIWEPNCNFNGGTNALNVYSKDFATLTLPTAGLYKVVFPMMWRAGWAENCAAAQNEGSAFDPNPMVSVGEDLYTINDIIAGAAATNALSNKEVTVGGVKKYVPDNQDQFQAFAQTGVYDNVFYVNAPSDNYAVKFTFSLRKRCMGGQWFIYNMPAGHIYKVTDLTDADLQKQAEALAAVKLGFEKGEYAPYTNGAAMEAYNKVKNASTKAALTAALSELQGATWTANTANMNAVYDGNFALCQNDGAMIGWGMTNNTLGGALHSRAFVLNPGDGNYANLAAFGQGDGVRSAAFIRFDGTNSDRGSQYFYGETVPYTMPLKAGVTYTFNADVALWGDKVGNLKIYVKGPDGKEIAGQTQTADANTNRFDNGKGTAPQVYNFTFTPTMDGNHTLWLQCPGADTQKHNNLISNISIKGPKLNQTITWDLNKTECELGETLVFNTATASSGLAVTYEVTAGEDCVDMTAFAEGKVTFIKKGNVTITATQAGDEDTYNAAAAVAKTFSIGVAKQTITWNPSFLTATNRVGSKVTLSGATASSGLAVTYALGKGDSLATIDGNVVTLLHVGELTVKAIQAGNEDYAPAEFEQVMTISKGEQTIKWNQELSGRVGDVLTLTAAPTSGLEPAYKVIGGSAEIVDGNKLKIVAADSITVAAFQAGNADYEAADSVVNGFNAGRGLQVITWDQTFFGAKVGDYIQLKGATASSGLAVTYSVVYGDPAAYELKDDVLFIKDMGTLKVAANQEGDELWDAAKPVIKDIFVEEGQINEMTLEAGVYQIYNEENTAFMLRNGNWGTMAVMGQYGQTVDVAYDVDRTMYIKFIDSQKMLFEDPSGNLFCDYQESSPADSNKWRYEAAEGEGNYILRNATTGNYISVVADEGTSVLKPFATDKKDAAAVFQFVKAAAIDSIHHAAKAEQFAALLSAASIDATYDGEYNKEAMATAFEFTDLTSRVTLPADRHEAYQPNSNKNEIDNTVEVLSFDLAMPEAGLYLIEVPAMYRNASNSIMPEYIAADMDFSATVMFTSDFTTMVCGLSAGLSATDIDYATKADDSNKTAELTVGDKTYWVPNSQDSFDAWVEAGYYANYVFAYAAAEGATVSVKATSSFGGNTWCSNWFVSNATKAHVYKMAAKGEGIGSIAVEEGEAAYFNIQGIQVAEPVPGQLYIKVQGGNATKVIFK